jgi:transposase-like protein
MYKYRRRPYNLSFRRSVVAEVESGRYTPREAASAHGVDLSGLYRWLKLYGEPETNGEGISMPNETDRIKELERQKKALEVALARANEKIILLESTVEVLEERYGGRDKKKVDRPSSSGPGVKGSA